MEGRSSGNGNLGGVAEADDWSNPSPSLAASAFWCLLRERGT